MLLCGIVLGIYLPDLAGEFLNWDDNRFVQENPYVTAVSLSNIKWAFSGFRFESYQPLQVVSYMFDGMLWPGNPWAYKVHNLVLFLIGGILLYGLLRRLAIDSQAAAFGTALFMLMPSKVEAVVWISARKEVLCLVFALLSWHLHVSVIKSSRLISMSLIFEYLFFALALLSKSSALVLPLIQFLLDYLVLKRPIKRTCLHISVPLALSIGIGVLLPWLWQSNAMVKIDTPQGPIMRAGLVFWSIAHYIQTVGWPVALSPVYAAPTETELAYFFVGGCVGSVVVIVGLFFLRRVVFQRPNLLLAAVSMFLGGLIPFINIVPMYFLVADRYLLFPSFAVSLGAAWLWQMFSQKKERVKISAYVVLLVLLCLSSIYTMIYIPAWKTSESLFQTATEHQPKSFWAAMKYGETLRGVGKFAASEESYRNARRIRPLSPSALGGVFWATLEQDRKTMDIDAKQCEKIVAVFMAYASNYEELRILEKKLNFARAFHSAEVVKNRMHELRFGIDESRL